MSLGGLEVEVVFARRCAVASLVAFGRPLEWYANVSDVVCVSQIAWKCDMLDHCYWVGGHRS